MLDIKYGNESVENSQNKNNRLNIRFKDPLKEDLNKFCIEKNIKSRAKVAKEALDFALNGKSDIPFDIKLDYSEELRKALEFAEGKKITANCPHCKGKVRLDPEHYKKFKQVEVKVKVRQSFIPGFLCSDLSCLDIHTNPNYQAEPKAYCTNCNQFAKDTSRQVCFWCKRQGTLVDIPMFRLDILGVPKPGSQ